MGLIEDAARIGRLGVVLSLRQAAIEPVLAAVTAAKPSQLGVGASALGPRLDVVMPYHPAALAALGTSLVAPPDATGLRIRCQGDGVTVAITIDGACPIADVGGDDAWRAIIEQLCALDGRIEGRARWSTGAALVQIGYPARDGNADRLLMLGIDQLAQDVGVSAAQRPLWLRIHPELGHGRELSIASWTRPDGGPSPHLGIRYPSTSWPLAIRLGQGLVLNDSEAKEVPTRLGQLAGAAASDPMAIELELGPHEPPDVIVWVPIGRVP